MNDLAYFCREPKNVLPAENNNNNRWNSIWNNSLETL